MRPGCKKDTFIGDDNGVMGISLSSDYCAEHEWGIKGIRDDFGIDSEKVGIDKRIISKDGSTLHEFTKTYEKKKHKCALLTNFDSYGWEPKEILKRIIMEGRLFSSKTQLAGAWDEKHFAVAVYGDEAIEALRGMKKSFEEKDMAIYLSSATLGKRINPFAGSALHICVASKIPEESKDDMYDHDMARKEKKPSGAMKKVIEGLRAVADVRPIIDENGNIDA